MAASVTDASPDSLIAATAAGVLSLTVDPLATFFGLLLCGTAGAVSAYSLGFVPGHAPAAVPATAARHRVPSEGHLVAGFHLFLGAMLLVFLAGSVLAFLLAWEAMSLVSYFLVLYDHEDPAVRRAAYVYLVMTHAGTAFVIAAFLLLAGEGGGFTFDALRAAGLAGGPTVWKTAVFVLALVGFGTKAGLLPLHVWLPRAHPAAPAHVSALMSGVMVKTGIYGLIRVGWDLLGAGSLAPTLPSWCGWLLLGLGVASAVLGVLHALAERDVKRLLAYSTVENVGIVFVGLGASLLLGAAHHPGAAVLALGAALLHALNHAAFKSLLFLGAGALMQGAHTKDLEEMGGLIRRMPWTAGAVLVGCAAIAGLPPLNGFPGEWLTLQSLVALAAGTPGVPPDVVAGVGAIGAVALLGLTAALALACFTKLFGGAFLALPRHHHAAEAVEVPLSLRWGMGILAASCIALGLAAGPTLTLADAAIEPLFAGGSGVALGGELTLTPWSSPSGAAASAGDRAQPIFSPVALLGGLLVLGALGVTLRAVLGRSARARRAATWVCGFPLEARMEYTPQAFADPLRLIFARAIQPFAHTEVDYAPGAERYFVHALRYRAGVHPPIERVLYRRGLGLLIGAAHRVRRLQAGSLRLYLAYMLAALAALLVWGR